MAWLIYLAQEKEIGKGCRDCRFLNDLKEKAECIADERVNVYDDNGISQYRPYCCPFRYYTDKVEPITKRFDGMTDEETAGWFKGADFQARRYAELEIERDNYIKRKAGGMNERQKEMR